MNNKLPIWVLFLLAAVFVIVIFWDRNNKPNDLIKAAESVPVELNACEKAENKKLEIKNLEDLIKKKEGFLNEAQKKLAADLEAEVKHLEGDLAKAIAGIQKRIDENVKKSNDLALENQKLENCKENSLGRLDAAKKDWDRKNGPSGDFGFKIYHCYPPRDFERIFMTYKKYFDYEKAEAKRFSDKVIENNKEIDRISKLVEDDSKLIISNKAQTDDAKARANRDFLDKWQKLNDAFLDQVAEIKAKIKVALEEYADLELACMSEKFLEEHKNDPLTYHDLPIVTPEFTLSVEDIIGDLFTINLAGLPALVGPPVDQDLLEIDSLVAGYVNRNPQRYRRDNPCKPIEPLVEPDPIEPKLITANSCDDLKNKIIQDKKDLVDSIKKLILVEANLAEADYQLANRGNPDLESRLRDGGVRYFPADQKRLTKERDSLRDKIDRLKDIKLSLSGSDFDVPDRFEIPCKLKDDSLSDDEKEAIINHFNNPLIGKINSSLDNLTQAKADSDGVHGLDEAKDIASKFCKAKSNFDRANYDKFRKEFDQYCKK